MYAVRGMCGWWLVASRLAHRLNRLSHTHTHTEGESCDMTPNRVKRTANVNFNVEELVELEYIVP